MAYPIMAPSNTWYKTSVLRSTITEINIVDSYTPTGNETETWNADVDNSGSIKCYLNGTMLTIAGNGSGKIALNEDSSYLFSFVAVNASSAKNMFISCSAINNLTIFDSSAVKNLRQAFGYCISVTELDLTGWDVSNVENMRFTFGANQVIGVMSLITVKGIENWDTGNVTTMQALFQYCGSLAEANVANWNVSKVTSMYGTFCYCSSLKAVSAGNWDTSSCTDMSKMFQGCSALTTVSASEWNTSACTNMQYMFSKCTSLDQLDISNWDVSKVTNFNSMFGMNDYGQNPPPITTLDTSNWDVSSATDMGWMFYGLANLTTLDVSKWNVSKVEIFHHCFAWCTKLVITGLENWDVRSAKTLNAMFHNVRNTTYDVSKWDVSNVESFGQMFEANPNLTNIYGLENWNTSKGKAFYEMFSNCSKLKELNLSSFDTRNANESWIDPQRNAAGGGMYSMFSHPTDSEYEQYSMHDLQKITLGKNFSFNGDGTCEAAILPAPLKTYIEDADGNWYDSNGIAHSINDIPNLTAGTYYASKAVIDEPVFVEYGTLYRIANEIRKILGTSDSYTPSEIIHMLRELGYDVLNLFDITKLTGEAVNGSGIDMTRHLTIQDDTITITTSGYSMGATCLLGQTFESGTYIICFEARNNNTKEVFDKNQISVSFSNGAGNTISKYVNDLSVYQEWQKIECVIDSNVESAYLSLVPSGGKDYPNPNFSFRNIRVIKQ